MANKKILYKASATFSNKYPELKSRYEILIRVMAEFIKKVGVAEVTVGVKRGEYYQHAN